jgi:hypothetical protein
MITQSARRVLIKRFMACALGILCIPFLLACESRQPAARAGTAIDHAGTEAGQAVGRAATATGNAIERAGEWVRQRTE